MRGRSYALKVCYRTSQQIRRAADRLLPSVLRDTDGLEDERRGVISVFDGPPPEVKSLADVAAETDLVRQTVTAWLDDGIGPHEIGLFVRTPQLVVRARAAIAGLTGEGEITTTPMSLAKGLEFRAVAVMACDEGVLPLDERVCALVLEYGGDDDQAIAGLLHDVIEDCGEQHRAVVRATFGDRVADIVEGCTDGVPDSEGVKAPWRQRKAAYLAHLRDAPPDTLLVSACDKLHNARAIAADVRSIGDEVFTRFKAGREGTLWYYGALLDVFGALSSG